MANRTRNTLDSKQLIRLFEKHEGNINQVAKEVGASYMGVRRNLLANGVKLESRAARRPSKATSEATSQQQLFSKEQMENVRQRMSQVREQITKEVREQVTQEITQTVTNELLQSLLDAIKSPQTAQKKTATRKAKIA